MGLEFGGVLLCSGGGENMEWYKYHCRSAESPLGETTSGTSAQ